MPNHTPNPRGTREKVHYSGYIINMFLIARSRTCGHRFSKAAILQHLKTSRSATVLCPFAGCSARVSKNTLDADMEMERRLTQHATSQSIEPSQSLAPRRKRGRDEEDENILEI